MVHSYNRTHSKVKEEEEKETESFVCTDREMSLRLLCRKSKVQNNGQSMPLFAVKTGVGGGKRECILKSMNAFANICPSSFSRSQRKE
jgi:hypothetical protein